MDYCSFLVTKQCTNIQLSIGWPSTRIACNWPETPSITSPGRKLEITYSVFYSKKKWEASTYFYRKWNLRQPRNNFKSVLPHTHLPYHSSRTGTSASGPSCAWTLHPGVLSLRNGSLWPSHPSPLSGWTWCRLWGDRVCWKVTYLYSRFYQNWSYLW